MGASPLLAGLASSAIVVMLSVAVVNEALEIRNRRRWTVLAQYVMLELVRDARMVWTAVVQLAGLMPSDANQLAAIDAAAGVVRDTPQLTEAVQGLLADAGRRRVLRDQVDGLVVHNDEVLGRWAAVMLNASAYAEVVDRTWRRRKPRLAGGPAGPGRAERRGPAAPAPGPEQPCGPDCGRDGRRPPRPELVAITQLAEELDRATLGLALKIVPIAWWEARLATTPDAGDEVPEANGRGQLSPAQGPV